MIITVSLTAQCPQIAELSSNITFKLSKTLSRDVLIVGVVIGIIYLMWSADEKIKKARDIFKIIEQMKISELKADEELKKVREQLKTFDEQLKTIELIIYTLCFIYIFHKLQNYLRIFPYDGEFLA